MNALDRPTLEELRDRLLELRDDPEARVVVLTGAGGKAFVAGADIKYMSGLGVDEAKEWGGLGHECGQLLETMPKPSIAAIDGFAEKRGSAFIRSITAMIDPVVPRLKYDRLRLADDRPAKQHQSAKKSNNC
jgi:1,4-dihydroxy-2-naphthoyl-CoA synthase